MQQEEREIIKFSNETEVGLVPHKVTTLLVGSGVFETSDRYPQWSLLYRGLLAHSRADPSSPCLAVASRKNRYLAE